MVIASTKFLPSEGVPLTIDILMTTYNGEKVLSQQLDSIRSQVYSDWRLLVRDDGSRDGTVGILEQYAKLDSRIVLVDRENGANLGVTGGVALLLSISEAEYL